MDCFHSYCRGHSLYRYGLATGAFSVGHEAVASASQLIQQLEASTKLRLQQRGGRVLPGTAALVAPIGSRCAAGCGGQSDIYDPGVAAGRYRRSLNGSFLTVSKPIFASNY